ncbi:hypothetical protein HANVADRAFT_52364 [Hanseniaspora valbyensis NRRL Y-1626]|uniref:Zinc finger PHD-type domain-containing protein n=1 Tax=Hanseniaspora valbyensis NRRL Y-1626 TaxID=766949 RepID=A0A1B7TF54_9ASCO|nr:hypothetical protein HANVADRAFT_52364 [Hanseniaspora valbyensis NRRL Y-1626]
MTNSDETTARDNNSKEDITDLKDVSPLTTTVNSEIKEQQQYNNEDVDDDNIQEEEEEDIHNGEVEEEEEHADDDGEEVTRCLCTLIQPPDPDNQGYIQCDSCAVWQHQACVGISPEKGEELEKYWCEECKPELHSLYDLKINRRLNNREPDDSLKRSQYNWELQQQTIHVEKRRRNGKRTISDSTNNTNDEDISISSEADPSTERRHPTRSSKRRGKTINGSSNNSNSSSRSNRNRSSAAEREEIQYQNMLKKVLQESRRDAYKDEEKPDVLSDGNTVLSEDPENVSEGGRRSKRRRIVSPKPEQTSVFEESQLRDDSKSQLPQSTSPQQQKQSPLPKRQTRRTAEREADTIDEIIERDSELGPKVEDDSVVEEEEEQEQEEEVAEEEEEEEQSVQTTTNVKTKRAYNRRSPATATTNGKRTNTRLRGKQANANQNDSSNNANDDSAENQPHQSHMDKLLQLAHEPSRPRPTPEGITIEEMKERAAAILEFLGRSQEELENISKQQANLLSFVENSQFIEEYQKNVNITESLEQMDRLTRDLISFQQNR